MSHNPKRPAKVVRLAVALTLLLVALPGRAKDAKRYEAIDAHALNAGPEVEASLPRLAAYLARPCKTDRDKARAIYRWITDRIAEDIEGRKEGKRPDQRAPAVLKARKGVNEGYCNLFVELSRLVNLKAVRISGHHKLPAHEPGQPVRNYQHDWVAVHVEGQWQLIDPTWGAGGSIGDRYVKRYKEYYFLVPPDELLFTHFPREAKWQLTKKPLTINEFEREPRLGGLFELGMSVQSVREAMKGGQEIVQATGPVGINVVAAKVPLTRRLKAGTEYEFEVKSPDSLRLYLGINMKPYRYLEKEGDVYRATIRPEKGDLKFGWMVEGEKKGTRILHYLVE